MKTFAKQPLSLRVLALWTGIFGLLVLQILLGRELKPFRSTIDQMPFPPSPLAIKALALGDEEFLFRAELSWLQDVGDGGGRLRPLREFDYRLVANWLRTIDRLDPQSDGIFQLGSTYFGAISDPKSAPLQLPPLIDYFTDAALTDPARRWHWLVWSAIKVQHSVKDSAQADRLAGALLSLRDNAAVPPWLPLLAAPLLRAVGDVGRAAALDADPDMLKRRREANEALRAKLSGKDAQ